MDTYIAYFDESGDDGISTGSSDFFILTSPYMNANDWKKNFDDLQACRKALRRDFGFHGSQEVHTKPLLSNKKPYHDYGWSFDQIRDLVDVLARYIAHLEAKIVNVIIDKNRIHGANYPILENALKYSIQRIENDCNNKWKYLIIADQGRIGPMRRTARAIRADNPIPSQYSDQRINSPVTGLIEDILEKNSAESCFIQVCDFVSYFVHLYYKAYERNEQLPKRVERIADKAYVGSVLTAQKSGGVLNLKAHRGNEFGLVIYPK